MGRNQGSPALPLSGAGLPAVLPANLLGMIRWDRLNALGVPVVVIAALACAVRAAWMFGERWGWAALAGSLLFLAFVLDKPAAPAHDDQQTQAIGAARGVTR